MAGKVSDEVEDRIDETLGVLVTDWAKRWPGIPVQRVQFEVVFVDGSWTAQHYCVTGGKSNG